MTIVAVQTQPSSSPRPSARLADDASQPAASAQAASVLPDSPAAAALGAQLEADAWPAAKLRGVGPDTALRADANQPAAELPQPVGSASAAVAGAASGTAQNGAPAATLPRVRIGKRRSFDSLTADSLEGASPPSSRACLAEAWQVHAHHHSDVALSRFNVFQYTGRV